MQGARWDDMRAALALDRAGTLSGAARALGCDATTVSRRLARLGEAAGAPMAEPSGTGRLTLTAQGRAMARAAAEMERAAEGAGTGSAGAAQPVRLTAVPILANHLLIPALPALLAASPGIAIDILAAPQTLDLSRREADLALRFARPQSGGQAHLARRVGTLDFAVYAAPGGAAGWIGYEEGTAHLPQARWTAAQDGPAAALRVADLEAAREAAAAGLGRAALPCRIGDADARLGRVEGAPPGRELWLVRHAGRLRRPDEEAVARWIAAL